GGKTTHLAQLMDNEGVIKAFDIYEHKINLIAETSKRLGIKIIDASVKDATALDLELPEWADFGLADVPCSGTGVLGRRADARWRKEPSQLNELPQLQLKILHSVSKCVKQNGVLVYSTCSIEPEENLGVISSFLKENQNYQLHPIESLLPFSLDSEDQKQAESGYFQFLPHVHGTDGFFVARLIRIK
ncbi:MAG: 16S rRNA (cytosine(967)-C(5))-methyltransferase RsmB, partial [Bacillota bacterium]|nr:16S rRNA (cytosine(967)-C(5))-methyltransferase RsmB [Bacillota bacterium]